MHVFFKVCGTIRCKLVVRVSRLLTLSSLEEIIIHKTIDYLIQKYINNTVFIQFNVDLV